MARSRVELFEQIRKDRRAAGSSTRALADRHQVRWRTVRQALDSAVCRHRAQSVSAAAPSGD